MHQKIKEHGEAVFETEEPHSGPPGRRRGAGRRAHVWAGEGSGFKAGFSALRPPSLQAPYPATKTTALLALHQLMQPQGTKALRSQNHLSNRSAASFHPGWRRSEAERAAWPPPRTIPTQGPGCVNPSPRERRPQDEAAAARTTRRLKIPRCSLEHSPLDTKQPP